LFQFSSPISINFGDISIAPDNFTQTPVVPDNHYTFALSSDNAYLILTFKQKFDPGNYVMYVPFSYRANIGASDTNLQHYVDATTMVKFTIQKDSVPVLSPPTQSVSTNASSVSFYFNKPILKIVDIQMSVDSQYSKPQKLSTSLAADNSILNVAVQNLVATNYIVDVTFSYNSENGRDAVQAKQTIKFIAK
jgi:hypothetical protein